MFCGYMVMVAVQFLQVPSAAAVLAPFYYQNFKQKHFSRQVLP
jgi:hypothetical protein